MAREAGHQPVLREEVLQYLRPAGNDVILDCTLGLGGHARAMMESAGRDARLIGMDADEENVLRARENLAPFRGRVRFFHANFADADEVLRQAEIDRVDVLLADLGFASTQVDSPERGLSFLHDGPLDMRFDRTSGETARDLVHRLDETELANLIYQLGEERFSRRIARAIVQARQEEPIETTGRLAEIIVSSYPPQARRNRRGVHPATRTFQALRIAVNDELASLETLLETLEHLLASGGRAGMISFHSLEDRRVKRAFAALAAADLATILTKKPITANEAEVRDNPRARSAKLRVIQFQAGNS